MRFEKLSLELLASPKQFSHHDHRLNVQCLDDSRSVRCCGRRLLSPGPTLFSQVFPKPTVGVPSWPSSSYTPGLPLDDLLEVEEGLW